MKTNQAVRTSVVLAFAALALGGCGGGSSSGGGFGFDLDDFGEVSNARTVAEQAATAEPNPGSVTQSSNVDGAGVTLDQIVPSVTFVNDEPGSRNLRINVRNARSWGTVSTTDRILDAESIEDDVGEYTFHRRTIGKRLEGGGAVVVDVYTDRSDPTDTDYMVGGVWVRLPSGADSVDDLEIGAFVDRTEALTGTAYLQTDAPEATYDGSAVGLGISDDDDEDGPLISQFFADVNLFASFGTTPKIKGEVRGFDEGDEDGISNLVLMLKETDIGNTEGGFFKGDTSVLVPNPDNPTGLPPLELTGKWGGQFYGDTAQHAAGTFGASITDPKFNAAFVGAFIADKE